MDKKPPHRVVESMEGIAMCKALPLCLGGASATGVTMIGREQRGRSGGMPVLLTWATGSMEYRFGGEVDAFSLGHKIEVPGGQAGVKLRELSQRQGFGPPRGWRRD